MSGPSPEKLTYIHARIEDTLVEFRDERISALTPANGLVIRERDGEPSSVIRLGTRDAVRKILQLSDEYDADPPADMQAWCAARVAARSVAL